MKHIINYLLCVVVVGAVFFIEQAAVSIIRDEELLTENAAVASHVSKTVQSATAAESFIESPKKLKKKRASVYDVARSAGYLNKETAQMIGDLSRLNESAGGIVSDVFEGPLAKEKQHVLTTLNDQLMELAEHVKKERQYIITQLQELAKRGSI